MGHAVPTPPGLDIIQRRLSPVMFGYVHYITRQLLWGNAKCSDKSVDDKKLLLLGISEVVHVKVVITLDKGRDADSTEAKVLAGGVRSVDLQLGVDALLL